MHNVFSLLLLPRENLDFVVQPTQFPVQTEKKQDGREKRVEKENIVENGMRRHWEKRWALRMNH